MLASTILPHCNCGYGKHLKLSAQPHCVSCVTVTTSISPKAPLCSHTELLACLWAVGLDLMIWNQKACMNFQLCGPTQLLLNFSTMFPLFFFVECMLYCNSSSDKLSLCHLATTRRQGPASKQDTVK